MYHGSQATEDICADESLDGHGSRCHDCADQSKDITTDHEPAPAKGIREPTDKGESRGQSQCVDDPDPEVGRIRTNVVVDLSQYRSWQSVRSSPLDKNQQYDQPWTVFRPRSVDWGEVVMGICTDPYHAKACGHDCSYEHSVLVRPRLSSCLFKLLQPISIILVMFNFWFVQGCGSVCQIGSHWRSGGGRSEYEVKVGVVIDAQFLIQQDNLTE